MFILTEYKNVVAFIKNIISHKYSAGQNKIKMASYIMYLLETLRSMYSLLN